MKALDGKWRRGAIDDGGVPPAAEGDTSDAVETGDRSVQEVAGEHSGQIGESVGSGGEDGEEEAGEVPTVVEKRQGSADWRRATKLYCEDCSDGAARYVCVCLLASRNTVRLNPLTSVSCRLYLCNVARHPRYGESVTCFRVWHGL